MSRCRNARRRSANVNIKSLLPSWERSLRAANKSPNTIYSYLLASRLLADLPKATGAVIAYAGHCSLVVSDFGPASEVVL